MMNTLAIFGLGTPEIIAILVIVFLLFGAKKLPEFARGLGKSLGEFKKAKSEFEEELLKTEKETMSDTPASKPAPLPSFPSPLTWKRRSRRKPKRRVSRFSSDKKLEQAGISPPFLLTFSCYLQLVADSLLFRYSVVDSMEYSLS